MPEVRIKTDFGEVVIPYSNLTELETGLVDIDKVVELVNSKVSGIVKIERRKPKPGFEDIYQINDDGSVSILKPGKNVENIGIVMFAYDPTPLKAEFVSNSSGVKNSEAVLTNKHYKKYFEKVRYGVYKLKADGLEWIINEIVPKLRATKQE